MIWNEMCKTSFADNETFNFYMRKKNHVFIEEDNPSD